MLYKIIYSLLISYKDMVFELKNNLQTNLKLEIDFVINKSKIIDILYLKNKGKYFSAYFANLLKTISFLKNEEIFNEGEPAFEMFFIKKGKVTIYSENDIEIYIFSEGNYFGEWDFFFNNFRRKFKCKTTNDCILYSLNKKDFKKIFFKEFINEKQLMISDSFKIYNDLIKLNKNALQQKKSINICSISYLTSKDKELMLKKANKIIKKQSQKFYKYRLDINIINSKFNKMNKILNNHINLIKKNNSNKIKKLLKK